MRARFASPLAARFRLGMLEKRTNEPPAGTPEARSYSRSREDESSNVPAEHLLRSVDRFVDLTGLRRELAPFNSQTGRPSVDPELMIRMLIDCWPGKLAIAIHPDGLHSTRNALRQRAIAHQ